MLKAYYDCGNQFDSRVYKTVTLAGLYGLSGALRRFEKAWNRILNKRGASSLHTTDALTLNGEFTKESGWTHDKVQRLISDLVEIIDNATRNGVSLISCTLILEDYKAAKKRLPDLVDPQHLLACECIGKAIIQHRVAFPKDDGAIALFFDRDEPFYGHVQNLWQRKDLQKLATWSSIKQLSEVSSGAFPAIQAADLLAWSINSSFVEERLLHDWQLPLHEIHRDKQVMNGQFFQQERLMVNVRRYEKLKLPKRSTMK